MRRSRIVVAAASVAALGLAACQEGAAGRRDRMAQSGDGGLCKPFANASQALAPGMGTDGAMVVDDCLHRWGYTLAKSGDSAEEVAQAVVAACSAPLARWNQQSLGLAAGGGQDAPSLLTGEPTNPIAEHNNFVAGRALFYVVQARAGKCDAPRVGDTRNGRAANNPAPAATYAPNSPDR